MRSTCSGTISACKRRTNGQRMEEMQAFGRNTSGCRASGVAVLWLPVYGLGALVGLSALGYGTYQLIKKNNKKALIGLGLGVGSVPALMGLSCVSPCGFRPAFCPGFIPAYPSDEPLPWQ